MNGAVVVADSDEIATWLSSVSVGDGSGDPDVANCKGLVWKAIGVLAWDGSLAFVDAGG